MTLLSLPSELCVVVCGMHRAGTSFVSRLVYEWGVYMGPPEITKSDVANIEGEYENRDFVNLNRTLMDAVGGSWSYPVLIKSIDDVLPHTNAIRAVIEKHRKGIWGWKDNRTAFTFHAYEPFLDNVLFVVCKREKEAVIQSIRRTHSRHFCEEDRNDTYFGDLYERYYEAIYEAAQPWSTLTVHYEDMVMNKSYNPELRHF